MRDLKTLQELAASITDWKSLKKISHKPFTPSILHLAISQHGPQLYSEEELVQLNNFSKLLSSVESRLKTNNTDQRVTRKRQIEETNKEERTMPMNKKPRNIILTKYGPSLDLPTEFKNRVTELNGHDLKFLMLKRFFSSDVKPNSSRLSMPINEIMCDFLTETEIEDLDKRESTRLLGVEVTLLDPCLREFTLPLTIEEVEHAKDGHLQSHKELE